MLKESFRMAEEQYVTRDIASLGAFLARTEGARVQKTLNIQVMNAKRGEKKLENLCYNQLSYA